MGIMRAARGWGKGEPRSKKENALQQAVSHRTWPIRSKPFLAVSVLGTHLSAGPMHWGLTSLSRSATVRWASPFSEPASLPIQRMAPVVFVQPLDDPP